MYDRPMARDAFICTCAPLAALLTKQAAIGQPAAAVCCTPLLCIAAVHVDKHQQPAIMCSLRREEHAVDVV